MLTVLLTVLGRICPLAVVGFKEFQRLGRALLGVQEYRNIRKRLVSLSRIRR